MRFAAPHVYPDPHRSPFYAGSELPEANALLRCPSCSGEVTPDAWGFHTRAERWHDALPEPLQEAVSALFGLQREARTDPWPGRLRDGRRPARGPLVCTVGDRAYSLVLRHLVGTMSEDDFESLARRLTAVVAARPDFADLELFHRYPFVREWTRQG
jgi:hypothetical protein